MNEPDSPQAQKKDEPGFGLSPVGYVVTFAIIVPALLYVGWPQPWHVTGLIALVGYGAGHIVTYLTRSKTEGDGHNQDVS